MTKLDVVEKIAREGTLEQMVRTITGGNLRPEHKDLVQDIFLELLEMPEDKVVGLYNRDQINYLLVRIIKNNIQSKTSRFYYRYRKFSLLNSGPESRAYREALADE